MKPEHFEGYYRALDAIALYDKVGFVREGLLRDAVLIDGEFRDAIAMSVIRRGPR
jgi:RimJ/RimL family protein N-acetyltransferase